MRLYKFVKPLQAFILTGSEIALANKCNLLGAKSWKSNASELNTFIRGDIKAREALKKKNKNCFEGISRKSLLLLWNSFFTFKK